MELYHGSAFEVKNIKLEKCKPFKDFGKGFYATSIKDQAIAWAQRKSDRIGLPPILNHYEFDDGSLSNLSFIEFDSPDENWGRFIINNRNKGFTNFSDPLSNQDNKYDIVHGLVANDDIAATLESFLIGILPVSEIGKTLEYRKLNNQYSFHTASALKQLTFIESEQLND